MFLLLVVEDEPFIGMELMDLGREAGFDMAGPALCSQSALTIAADRPPDIAIVDVNLTDGPTGPFVASQLSQSFGTEVLVITANPELVAEGVGGVSVVLTEPFDPEEVANVLRMLSDRRDVATSGAWYR